LADYVLPAATQFELDDIGHYGLPHGFITARRKIVEPPGEARPDLDILCALGRALGHGDHFPADWRDVLEEVVEPAGLSYEELAERGYLRGEDRSAGDERQSFKTPSKRVELFSTVLEKNGFAPLPCPEPELDPTSERYPLCLISAKSRARFLSLGPQLEASRRMEPEPTVTVHPDTAHRYGLRAGGWVWIETRSGRIRQRLRISARVPSGLVCAATGWAELPNGFRYEKDWARSNFNVLTAQDEWGGELGTSVLRPLACRLEPVE
jgi:anaerobic selenocysteine-containing dehydrogenase